jgi:tetratricopeptide (TPR) repeat protein
MNRKGHPVTRSIALGFILLGSLLRANDASGVVDNDTSPYHQALLDYKSGKYDDAQTAIDAADKAKPGDPATEILKSRILTELGDFPAAEKALLPLLGEPASPDVLLALGDLSLRKRSFDKAARIYGKLLAGKPNDPDITLKLVYAQIGAGDLVGAGQVASQLKPLDSKNPYDDHASYYFAKAALAQATGKTQEADDDIQTARTIYGIRVTNRYLKTYLEVFASSGKTPASAMTPPPR